MKQEKKYFDLLQVFRGIASLLVVIHHSYASFAHYHHLDNEILHFIAGVGKLGVDFFFVLSSMSTVKDVVRAVSADPAAA